MVKRGEGVKNLDKELSGFFFREGLVFLEVLREIALVAVLEDQIEVVGCLLDVVKFDDVFIFAGLKDCDFVLQKLEELAWVCAGVPLMLALLMALMAMSQLLSLL